MELLQYKDISTSMDGVITDVDKTTGMVKGYFSIFGNIDSDKDMVMPGAFTKTLNEQGGRVRHLWQHDPAYPLSRPVLNQDSKGLGFESKITPTTYGKNVVLLYDDGVVDEHSMGYRVVKRTKRDNYQELNELKLWEGSTVTWGANGLAVGGPMKSMTRQQAIDKMDKIYKALRNGRYEGDEIFIMLDLWHEQLKRFVFDLSADKEDTQAATEEAPEPAVKSETGEKDQQIITSLCNLFVKNGN